MSVKRRGLGRGLDALLSGTQPRQAPAAADVGTEPAATPAAERFATLPVDVMQRGRFQPRHDMRPESLEDLAGSIRAQGVVQPIVVRPVASAGGLQRYEIIAGERRWRAAQMAGLHEVPVVVRDVPDRAAIAMALIENIQRENLNPLEEAAALRRLIDEFELTHEEAATAVGRSRAAVSNLLRLFELNDDVKQMIERRELEMGHARALLAIAGAIQSQAAKQVVAKGLSVRETEQLARRLASGKKKSANPVRRDDPDVRRLEEDLAGRLGASVSILSDAKGKGKLVVHYNSLDELEGILAHIK
jgi:ParB family transcriptional regulator, chromosome partitioning protein